MEAHSTPAALASAPVVNTALFAFKNRDTVSLVRTTRTSSSHDGDGLDIDGVDYLINGRHKVTFDGADVVHNCPLRGEVRYQAVARASGWGKWFLRAA